MLLKLLLSACSAAQALASAQQVPIQQPPNELPLYSPELALPQSTTKELLYLHRKLVEIESITGNEENVGRWLASYLEAKNFTVDMQEVAPKRYNILAYEKQKNTPTLVTSHIDTVPPYWPYKYNKTSGFISGRGSVDAKGSVAAQIMAYLALREQETLSADSASLLFVVGEEVGADGMRYFSDHAPHSYKAVIFGEPTEAKLVCGHKGNLGVSLKIRGKAAHSGYPWLGVSANDVMVEALAELLELRKRLPWSTKYGNTTINFGHIDGGVAANVIAENAEASLAVRLAAATPEIIKGMIVDALDRVKCDVEKQGGELEIAYKNSGYPPVDIDCDVEGFDTLTVNYGTDIPYLKGDHKRYLYGPGSIFVAHSDHEALNVSDLQEAVLGYQKLILATL